MPERGVQAIGGRGRRGSEACLGNVVPGRANAVPGRASAPGATADPHAELVRRLFDAKARAWPAKYAPGGPLVDRLVGVGEAVRRQVRPGGLVLDLGCGTGELARWLGGVGLRVAGCDISGEMLRGAAARGVGRWVLLDPGWRRLPFADAGFDAVVAASVLEYTADPGAALAECARVLRPGGVLVCTVPDLRHPVRWLEWLCLAPARASSLVSPRLAHWRRYQRYLRASRQRHRLGWWLAAALGVGLRLEPGKRQTRSPRPAARPRPLRLLTLRATSEPGGRR